MTVSDKDVSVIMAVYGGVEPSHLTAALQSLVEQTLPPSEVLISADGPLPRSLETAIETFGQSGLPIRRLDLPVRSGAGPARQHALLVASSAWVAVADADDISTPHRLECQVDAAVNGRFDIVGAAMIEFSDDWAGRSIRSAPASQAEIIRRLTFNNPFNHPTVLMRRGCALSAGGYADLPYLEDYDLMVRLMAAGARACNLQEPLVHFRVGDETLRRRRARSASASEWRMQQSLRRGGFVSLPRAIANFGMRTGYRVLPPSAQKLVHRNVLSRRLATEVEA